MDLLRQVSLAQHYQDSEQSLGNGTGRENGGGTLVRHLLDVKNARFLYTAKVYDKLYSHLVSGFDYRKYRKTDYIDVE